MRLRYMVVVALTIATMSANVVLVGHVGQIDPATVPTGFLASHTAVSEIPVDALAKAVQPDGASVLVQHVRLGSNSATGWHTHPGPAIVSIVRGSLTYEDAASNRCRQKTYPAGTGFTDRGFGHVHRAVAGSDGVDFYVTYILPPDSSTHVISASAPAPCA